MLLFMDCHVLWVQAEVTLLRRTLSEFSRSVSEYCRSPTEMLAHFRLQAYALQQQQQLGLFEL